MTDWQHTLSTQIARNVEYYRRLRGLRRTELAARCTALGLPTKRPALAALLDGRRQTITVQALVVLAEALDTSLAQLIVPLHTGERTLVTPDRTEHAFTAAEHLFGLTDDARAYRPYIDYQRARRRFERANARLADLSHAIATGSARPHNAGGRPHPASEILAAEAALFRLLKANSRLRALSLLPPPQSADWAFIDEDAPPTELPLMALLPDHGKELRPLFVYRINFDALPSARRIEPE